MVIKKRLWTIKPRTLWKDHKEVALENGIEYKTFAVRIYKGWTPEDASGTFYHCKRDCLFK